MSAEAPRPPRPLPRWLLAAGSVVIAAHLFALGILALAAPSGPWPSPFGTSMATPPPFAQAVADVTTQYYLRPLRLSHNYHFLTNRPAVMAVYLDFKLRDDEGKELATVRIPDDKANPWVRHRQLLLAQQLTEDAPTQARPGEVVAAPNQEVRQVEYWDMGPDRQLVVKTVPEHLIPRDRPVMRPSDWGKLLAHSYVRHLCRQHGAAAAELTRTTREPVPPALMFVGEQAAGPMDKLVSNFGEIKK